MPKKSVRPTPGRRVVSLELKAAADDSRTFEGLAAVWTKDLGNDVIHRGAFKNTIAEWRKSNDAIPLLNSHDRYSILSSFGQLVDAKETPDGLWTKWEVIDGAEGDAVLNRLRPSKITRRPIVGKMSIGYLPVKYDYEQPDGTDSFFDRIRNLYEVKLDEVSLVLFAMAPGAAIDASTVKGMLLDFEQASGTKIDALTRKELRKLSARIGNLLKKSESNPAAQGTGETAPDPKSATPPAIEPTADATDEADEEVEDDDPETDGKAKPPVAESLTTEEDIVAEVVTEPEVPEEPAIKLYQYPDALAHKLQALALKNKIASIGSK